MNGYSAVMEPCLSNQIKELLYKTQTLQTAFNTSFQIKQNLSCVFHCICVSDFLFNQMQKWQDDQKNACLTQMDGKQRLEKMIQLLLIKTKFQRKHVLIETL